MGCLHDEPLKMRSRGVQATSVSDSTQDPIFGRSGVFVLEFKQREPPPFDGFAKETRGYLRLIEKWHPYVPRMTARGALVLTHAVNFGKKYEASCMSVGRFMQ